MADSQPATRPAEEHWLPDFCSLPALAAVLGLAELVVLVILLAPGAYDAGLMRRVVVGSVFVEWLALCCALALCRLRATLAGFAPLPAASMAYACVLAIVAIGSALVYGLDQELKLGFTPGPDLHAQFVGGNTLIAALVTAAAFRYFYVRAQWRLQVDAQAKAQVMALQARIRPHFLFNSMNTIISLVRGRPHDAERAVEDLSELFRAALAAEDKPRTLGDELDLVRRYLDIETLRLGERLRLQLELDHVPLDLRVPPLLLQPLVENAVLHGIQPLPEGGTVRLAAEVEADRVRIHIHNPRPRNPAHRAHGNRTALDNVRQRMRYHYGERGGLDVDEGPDYYAVTVSIPRN